MTFPPANPQCLYKIRPKQAKMYLFLAVLSPIYPILFTFPLWLRFMSKDIFPIILTSIAVVAVLCMIAIYFYAKNKVDNLALVIDENGIRTNSFWLGIIPNFHPITWQPHLKAVQIDNFTQTIMGKNTKKLFARFDSTLVTYDKVIMVIDPHKGAKPRFTISNTVWEIEDIEAVKNLLAFYQLPVESNPSNEILRTYLPQMADMGKRAGKLAYASIGLLLGGFILLFFDKYATLDFGFLKHFLIFFGILIALISGWWILQDKPRNFSGLVVLLIFTPITVFCLFSLLLLISPVLGKQEQATFQFKESKKNYATWVQIDNAEYEVFCNENNPPNKANRTIPIIHTLSMTRIRIAKLCLPNKVE